MLNDVSMPLPESRACISTPKASIVLSEESTSESCESKNVVDQDVSI